MKIRLTEYTEKWREMYEEEVQRLTSIFGEEIISFEHFGSTSIPGMKAKPVIDMMCIVRTIEKIDAYNEKMKSLNYDVAGEWGINGRRLFRKGGEERTHHIHCYQMDNPHINRHLLFRDYLLAHPAEAQEYSNFKQQLADKYDSTSDYSPAKKTFVSELEKRAMHWAENTYKL
ncbi:GrpB family protein [Halobacillus salinarum]|uniref:GrpB family protein n=1 Tax=Halobacillus salinarum TaxID=2932257 RepID=A0ABY4EPK0_9BACI|nr:GrpB family protein [Halobacillus salinarum]UOQ45920.1 GrpB family protein [Halobacillus salinarum]